MRRSSLTPSAGPARRRGVHSLAPAFPTPGHCQDGFPRSLSVGSPERVPGVCLWLGLFLPATTRLGRWNRRLWAPSGVTFWVRRAPSPWAARPPRARCPRCQLCRRSPQPAAAAYARRRFCVPPWSRDGLGFLPFCLPLDGQRGAGLGLGIFSLSLFGEAVPRRLTFALLPHFMLCNCLAVAFPFPGLCRTRGSLASSYLPIPGHRAVPGPGGPGPLRGCGGG